MQYVIALLSLFFNRYVMIFDDDYFYRFILIVKVLKIRMDQIIVILSKK